MEGRDGYGFTTNNTDMLKDPQQELASQHKLFCANKRLLCDKYPLLVGYMCEIQAIKFCSLYFTFSIASSLSMRKYEFP
jgi:hypothetical protein